MRLLRQGFAKVNYIYLQIIFNIESIMVNNESYARLK